MSSIDENLLLNNYLHHIRNFKLLTDEMLNNIKYLSEEDKMNIIIALNRIVQSLLETYNDSSNII